MPGSGRESNCGSISGFESPQPELLVRLADAADEPDIRRRRKEEQEMRSFRVYSPSCFASSFHEYVTQPIIISSQVWSPQRTVFLGSGLAGLSFELSKWATQCSVVPFGTATGFSRR